MGHPAPKSPQRPADPPLPVLVGVRVATMLLAMVAILAQVFSVHPQAWVLILAAFALVGPALMHTEPRRAHGIAAQLRADQREVEDIHAAWMHDELDLAEFEARIERRLRGQDKLRVAARSPHVQRWHARTHPWESHHVTRVGPPAEGLPIEVRARVETAKRMALVYGVPWALLLDAASPPSHKKTQAITDALREAGRSPDEAAEVATRIVESLYRARRHGR